MDEVAQRRRLGRWGVPRGEPEQVALKLLSRLLADESHRIAEELVWWRLVIATKTRAPVTDVARPDHDWEEGSLPTQFQLATRGWADPADEQTPLEPHDPTSGDQDSPDPLMSGIDDHDTEAAMLIDKALDLIGVAEPVRWAEATRIRALVDGLNLAVCLGRLTPTEAVAALAHHIATVRVAA